MSEHQVEVRTVPLWPAALTLSIALAAAVLVAFTVDASSLDSFRLSVLGYFLGAVAVPIGVAAHRYRRDEAKRNPYFDPRYFYDKLAAAGMAIGLIASVWHAFVIATELAR